MILVFNQGEYAVYARTPAEELKAYLLLFKIMDKRGYYNNVPYLYSGQQAEAARNGDGEAAKRLLTWRSNNYYSEGILELEVQTP
jgi:hypothetical protein